MRIAKLDLARYGHFTDRALHFPAGDMDLHIVLGANEAGKSTARSAIADLLYGIPHGSPMGFLHPGSDMLIGAVIDGVGGSLSLERRKKRKDPLTRATGEVVTDTEMSALLAGIDREAFERMFCMDLDGLRSGARDMLAAKDDVSQLLFGSASGLPGLSSIRAELKSSIGRLYTPRKSGAELYAAVEAYRQADKACQEASLKLTEHKRLGREVDEAVEAYEAATLRARQATDTLSNLQRIKRTAGLLMRLDGVRRDLAERADAPALPEDAEKTHRVAAMAISEAGTRRRLAEERRATVDAELKALPPTAHITTVSEQIQASLDEIRAVSTFEQEIAAARVEAQTAEKAARHEAATLGWHEEGVAQIAAMIPSKPARLGLKAAARSLVDAVAGSKTAKAHLAECAGALETAQARLAEAPRRDVSPSLRSALNAARAAQSDYRDAERHKAELARLVGEGKAACASLAPGAWTSDALDALLLPSPAHAQSVDNQVRDYDRAIAAAEDAADAAERTLSSIAAQIDSASGGAGVTLEAVRQARNARDEIVRTALSTGDLAAAEETLPAHIVEADRLADDRFASSTESLRIDALMAKREDATAALAGAKAAKVSAQSARASAIRNWQESLPDARLREIPLSQYEAWHAKATSIIALRASARSAAAEAEASFARGEAARNALASEIRALEPSASSDLGMGPMIEWADQFISKQDGSAARAEERSEQLAAAEARHRRAAEGATHAETLLGEARLAWRSALSSVSLPDSVTPEDADALLTDIESIDALVSNVQRITGERIDGPQVQLSRAHARFATLVGENFPQLAGRPIDAAAQSIAEALREAVQAERDRVRLRGELSAAADDAAEALAAEELARSAVAPLMRDAGVDSLEALPAAIGRASEVRRLRSGQEALLNDLAAQSDGRTEEQLTEDAKLVDAGELDGLIAEAQVRLAEASAAVEAAVERKTQLTERQLAGAGSDAAAIAASDREAAKARLEEAGAALVELMIQDALLKRGVDDFRERNQGPMLARARDLFPQLTRGAYSDLCIDQSNDVPVLQGVSATGARVDIAGMSESTRDQLYMALRLSALQLRVETGGALPFIADDLLMAFDDSRAEAGFRVLGDMAQRQQVIYFTHHEHLIDVARHALGNSVSVIDLAAEPD